MNEPETIREILEKAKTIAVIGLSLKPSRPSHGVSLYMQQQGYRIIPVNPAIQEALGEKAYPDLDTAVNQLAGQGVTIDLVNVFRAPRYVPAIVDDVIRLKLPYLWLQQGVCDEEAARRAEAAGVKVMMDLCLYRTHAAYQS